MDELDKFAIFISEIIAKYIEEIELEIELENRTCYSGNIGVFRNGSN